MTMTRVEHAMAVSWRGAFPQAASKLEDIRAFDKKLGSQTSFFHFPIDTPSAGAMMAAGLIFQRAENGHIRLTERGRTWADMP